MTIDKVAVKLNHNGFGMVINVSAGTATRVAKEATVLYGPLISPPDVTLLKLEPL